MMCRVLCGTLVKLNNERILSMTCSVPQKQEAKDVAQFHITNNRMSITPAQRDEFVDKVATTNPNPQGEGQTLRAMAVAGNWNDEYGNIANTALSDQVGQAVADVLADCRSAS